MKVYVFLAVLAVSAVLFFGGKWFVKSRVDAVRNGTACYCDIGM